MRFLLLVASLCLLAASAYLVVILGLTPYRVVEQLGHVSYYEYVPDGPTQLPLALTPGGYAAFRTGIWAGLVGSLLSSVLLLAQPAYRRQLRRLGQEVRRARAALGRPVRHLSGPEKTVAGGLLLLILLARIGWLLLDPMSPDEITSYDSFVRQGAAAVASFYPIPNNHVFYNFTCWVVAQALPHHVLFVMRLPSLLVATAGTGLSYALLAHFRNFRVATLVTALFDLTQLTLSYATAGRGYYLQLVCIQLSFFAVLGLVTARGYRRLGWAVLVTSSAVGLYTVPTYAAPLASLWAVLLVAGLRWPSRKQRPYYGQVFLAGAVVILLAGGLYTPVGTVSGWSRLLTNRYLAPHSFASFCRIGRAYLYETAGMLLGPPRPALVCGAAFLGLTPLVLLRARASRASWASPRGRWLAWGAWAMLVVPAVLMLAQRVFIPARALMYTTYFLFLLATLAADCVANAWRPNRNWVARLPLLLLLILLGYRVAEVMRQGPILRHSREQVATVSRVYQWLQTQPRGAVLMGASFHGLMFHHYGLLDGGHPPLVLRFSRVPGERYPYLVWPNGHSRPAWAALLPYRLAYQDALIRVYALTVPPAKGH